MTQVIAMQHFRATLIPSVEFNAPIVSSTLRKGGLGPKPQGLGPFFHLFSAALVATIAAKEFT
jgi:hypothetical protein